MSIHKKISFETEICEHLAANGWLYEDKDAAGFVRGLALFPADVLAWVQATQPGYGKKPRGHRLAVTRIFVTRA